MHHPLSHFGYILEAGEGLQTEIYDHDHGYMSPASMDSSILIHVDIILKRTQSWEGQGASWGRDAWGVFEERGWGMNVNILHCIYK